MSEETQLNADREHGSISTSHKATHPLEVCSTCGMTWSPLGKLVALLAALRKTSITCVGNGEKCVVTFELL